MALSLNFTGVEASFGGKDFPPAVGYKMKIVNIADGKSKKGDEMFTFFLDIADGKYAGFYSEHPLRVYRTYSEAKSLARLKGDLIRIAEANPAMFPKGLPDNVNIMMFVGMDAYVKTRYSDKGYLEIDRITTKEDSEAQAEIPRPEYKPADKSSGDSDLPF
jgi:hypothetical protein